MGPDVGETVLANENDTKAFVRTIGLKDVFDLGNRNHRMDDMSRMDLRGRLIFSFASSRWTRFSATTRGDITRKTPTIT